MAKQSQAELRARVHRAAEAALAHHSYVSAIDVLNGIGWLQYVHMQDWHKGRINTLDETIQTDPKRVSAALRMFREWAVNKGLQPSETEYARHAPGGIVHLRFTLSGDPELERTYRTHFVSATLPERKQQQLKEKLSRPAQPVVFHNLRESECSECGTDIPSGGFLLMEAGQPLCMACAGLDELEYLPAGDSALTRRSTKYSARTAVVVRFSRSRGRYERQGILVDPAALERAEAECLEDADERAAARIAGAARRQREDAELVARMTARIAELYPNCPPAEAAAIAAHTALRHSGRVGRSAAGRSLEAGALHAAVNAAVRHRLTDYDLLLSRGVERQDARERVAARVQAVLASWEESS